MQEGLREKLTLCLLAGEVMLKNGAGTWRVVDTAERIGEAVGLTNLHILVIPSSIILTVEENEQTHTRIVRIKERTVNLDRVDKVNRVSRQLCAGDITFGEAAEAMRRIAREHSNFSYRVATVATGIVGGSFAYLQGGTLINVLPASIAAATVRVIAHLVVRQGGARFVFEFFGGMAAASIGLLLPLLFPVLSRDIIIIGGILPLVPGMTIVTAIRDLIAGELLSGILLGIEALVTFTTIAMGVVAALAIGLRWSL